MKFKTQLLALASMFIISGHSQTAFQIIDYNNVEAQVSTNGIFFTNSSSNTAGYKVSPSALGSAIYSTSFWFAGKDENDQLHMSAHKYNGNRDMFSGPIATDYNDANYLANFKDLIWTVRKIEIDDHIANYNSSGYVVPSVIEGWPANGDTDNGMAQDLAPYIDQNYNGIYDPENGDYPNIRGDEATYLIFNDAAQSHTESSADSLGMEFHFMFYQYATNDYLNNTTFLNVRVFNRSSTTYTNFRVAQFTDGDLGDGSDDFYASSPQNDMMICYNGDPNDNEFGAAPPVVSVKMLNQNMDVSGNLNNGNEPNTAAEFWGYMNAEWGSTGVHFTEGGNGNSSNVNTNYLFSGDEGSQTWTEATEGNLPGDRKMFMSSDGKTISPNEQICFDYVYLYSGGGTYEQNIDGIYSLAEQSQLFYDTQSHYSCETVTLNIEDNMTSNVLSVVPNPSSGQFLIKYTGQFDLEIYNISGQKVIEQNNNVDSKLITADLTTGIYLVHVISNGHTSAQKLIIK